MLETIARTFIIPSGQNQFIQENVSNNASTRRNAITMNTNSAFTGHFEENDFFIIESLDWPSWELFEGGELLSQLIQPTIVELMLQQGRQWTSTKKFHCYRMITLRIIMCLYSISPHSMTLVKMFIFLNSVGKVFV